MIIRITYLILGFIIGFVLKAIILVGKDYEEEL